MVEIFDATGCKESIAPTQGDETIFEYWPNAADSNHGWSLWKPEEWKPPKKLAFSTLLIPTLDCRAL